MKMKRTGERQPSVPAHVRWQLVAGSTTQKKRSKDRFAYEHEKHSNIVHCYAT